LDWTGLDWNGLDWTGMDWTGLDWTGLDWTGMDWSCQYISLLLKTRADSAGHPDSYSKSNGDSFLGGKTAEA
jgi:hypothetical protein